MKKVLLSTSAIALVGAFATSASANEWDVKVGGYMEQFIGYADVDINDADDATDEDEFFSGYDGVDVKSDAEISFVPSITLDNGIQFGANVQLEANTGGDQIDESYLFIDGSFGEVLLGSENSAGYKMSYGAPDVTVVGVNSGSTTAFIPFSGTLSDGVTQVGSDVFRGTLGTTFLEVGRNNDAQRVTYFTPRFAGFQLGASYARDGQQDSNAQVDTDVAGTLHDIFDIGANYVNSFGDFNVAISGRYGFGSVDEGDDPEIWGVGANLGYAGFTVGGSYAESDESGVQDGEAWDAGVSYETGPWGVSFTWFSGESVDNDPDMTANGGNGNGMIDGAELASDEELDQWIVGLSYTVAKGVKIGAFGGWADFEESAGDDGTGAGTQVDGWFAGASTAISF